MRHFDQSLQAVASLDAAARRQARHRHRGRRVRLRLLPDRAPDTGRRQLGEPRPEHDRLRRRAARPGGYPALAAMRDARTASSRCGARSSGPRTVPTASTATSPACSTASRPASTHAPPDPRNRGHQQTVRSSWALRSCRQDEKSGIAARADSERPLGSSHSSWRPSAVRSR